MGSAYENDVREISKFLLFSFKSTEDTLKYILHTKKFKQHNPINFSFLLNVMQNCQTIGLSSSRTIHLDYRYARGPICECLHHYISAFQSKWLHLNWCLLVIQKWIPFSPPPPKGNAITIERWGVKLTENLLLQYYLYKWLTAYPLTDPGSAAYDLWWPVKQGRSPPPFPEAQRL